MCDFLQNVNTVMHDTSWEWQYYLELSCKTLLSSNKWWLQLASPWGRRKAATAIVLPLEVHHVPGEVDWMYLFQHGLHGSSHSDNCWTTEVGQEMPQCALICTAKSCSLNCQMPLKGQVDTFFWSITFRNVSQVRYRLIYMYYSRSPLCWLFRSLCWEK